VHLEVVALLDLLRQEEPPEKGGGADHQQAGGEDREHGLIELVPELSLQQVEDPDTEDRQRDAARCHPVDERDVHGLELQVPPAAGRLGDRGVGDVSPDRSGRLDPEDQDEQRRHDRATAHAGETDQEADAEAEDDDRWIHGGVSGESRGRWDERRFPTSFPFMTEPVLKEAAKIAEAALSP
jgi:hypothetical protein